MLTRVKQGTLWLKNVSHVGVVKKFAFELQQELRFYVSLIYIDMQIEVTYAADAFAKACNASIHKACIAAQNILGICRISL